MQSDADPAFDPLPVLRALADGGIDFVVIGGLAGAVHGSSYPTYDVHIAYARDRGNLERLAQTLRELGATLRGAPPDLPFQLDADALEEGGNFTFATRLGKLDILAYAAGAPSYDALRAAARVERVAGHALRFASLDHLIAMKEAAARPKDKLMATEYRVLADELRAQRD